MITTTKGIEKGSVSTPLKNDKMEFSDYNFDTSKPYALLTGASMGIGRSMAHKLAKLGHYLILVSLPNQALKDLTVELEKTYSIKAIPYEIDLTLEDAPKIIFDFCTKYKIEVDILINNAGFGLGGLFETIDLAQYNKMMSLNTQAIIGLTHYFLPKLKQHQQSHILNTSSMEALLPIPYKSVYTATKGFIYSFSLALREEVRPYNVNVSVLCPGSVLTNEDGLKRIKAMGWKAKMMVMMPDEVAHNALDKMFQKKGVIVPGGFNKFFTKLGKVLPTSIKMNLLEKVFSAYKEH
ncbi:MAG: SDR family NAD(P)-dependent oxidoreductase [Chitinophagales bacterium]